MMKEFVRANRTIILGFKEYLEKKLKTCLLHNSDLKFNIDSPVFKTSGWGRKSTIGAKIMIKSFSIKYYTEKDFNGVMFGVDLSDFSLENNLIAYYGFEEDEIVHNRFGSAIYYSLGGTNISSIWEQLNLSNDDIERGMIVSEFLEKKGVDIGYVKEVYPNVLDFFYDVCVPNELLYRNGNDITIDVKTSYYNTKSKFFTGPYGKEFCEKLYNQAVKKLKSDFLGFYLREDYFEFIKDRQFLPIALVLTKEPSHKDIITHNESGLYFYDMSVAEYYTSLNRLNGKGGKKSLGFFNGEEEFIYYRRSYLNVSMSYVECLTNKTDSYFNW